MDINKLSTEELLLELYNRSITVRPRKSDVLVFGTIGIDGNKNFIELFEKIEIPKDLDFLPIISIRARYNSHRNYQGFYFRTHEFEALKNKLDNNNEQFANWIRKNRLVNFCNL